jgi:hypothetical protein
LAGERRDAQQFADVMAARRELEELPIDRNGVEVMALRPQ